MIIEEHIVVDAPIEQVWSLIDRLESVIPCLPGATYNGQEGDDHLVGIKVRIGVISVMFKGKMRFVEKDPVAHLAIIEGSGRDAGGKGAAKATIVGSLEPLSATRTKMAAKVNLAMSGRIAQFGGPIVEDIAKQLVTQFGANLQRQLLSQKATPIDSDNTLSSVASETVATRSGEALPSAPASGEIRIGYLALARIGPYVFAGICILVLLVVGLITRL
jgi:carbon monoxide dehydrogenase subunit G